MIQHPPRSTLFPCPTHFRSQTEAARLLGMSRDQVRYRVEKHGLIAGWRRADHGSAEEPILDTMLPDPIEDRKSTRLNSSHANISDAVLCLKNTTIPA